MSSELPCHWDGCHRLLTVDACRLVSSAIVFGPCWVLDKEQQLAWGRCTICIFATTRRRLMHAWQAWPACSHLCLPNCPAGPMTHEAICFWPVCTETCGIYQLRVTCGCQRSARAAAGSPSHRRVSPKINDETTLAGFRHGENS